jgi:DNA (cytosine-5)-methyltransferase 1
MTILTLGSVCSGIGGAEEAFNRLASPIFCAEIERQPAAILATRHPGVPNYGDMTKIADRIIEEGGPGPDILVGGTPCQAFSVAGLRRSLDDLRGNLTIELLRIVAAVDSVRSAAGEEPCVLLWENVPGVLSTKDNAFGCFLAGLVGADEPLRPGNKSGKWTRSGLVRGPKGSAGWRILDAQFFGLAQRRERVFVVASARPGFDPRQVLFEPEGVRRHHPPSREAGQSVTGTLAACTLGGGRLGTDFDLAGGLVPENVYAIQERAVCENPLAGPDGLGVKADGLAYTLEARGVPQAVAYGGNDTRGPISTTTTLTAHPSSRYDFESDTFVLQPVDTQRITHTPRADGFDASEDGTGRGTPLVAVAVALRGRDGGATAELGDDLAFTLRASGGGGDKPHVLSFDWYASSHQYMPVTPYCPPLKTTMQPAVHYGSAVRRLMPSECEKLQGYEPVKKRVIMAACYGENQKSAALAEIQNPKSPLSVWLADAAGLIPRAEYVVTSLNEKSVTHERHVVVLAQINLERKVVLLSKAGKLLLRASYADDSDCSPHIKKVVSSVLALVRTPVIEAPVAASGKAVSRLNAPYFLTPVSGSRSAPSCGPEPKDTATAAAINTEAGNRCTTSIISRVTQDIQSCEETRSTLVCSALDAINSFTQNTTLIENAFLLLIETENGYTATISAASGKIGHNSGVEVADGPRYKALGNSFAVPVVRWLAQRIVAHMSGLL